MSDAFGGSIEAVLTLNATKFDDGITKAVNSLGKFKDSSAGIERLNNALIELEEALQGIGAISKSNVTTFNKLANAIRFMANGLEKLSGDTIDVELATNTMNNIFKAFQGTLSSVTVKLDRTTGSLAKLSAEEIKASERVNQMRQHLANMRNSYESSVGTLMRFARALNSEEASLWKIQSGMQNATSSTRQFNNILNPASTYLERMNSALLQNRNSVMAMITGQEEATAVLERNSQAMRRNGAEQLRNMGYTGRLSAEEEKLSASTSKATSSVQRQSTANRSATASTNQLSSATSRLGKAMSSLRMMGSLVGSMLAYNFAHKLLVATGETIHAKSEMEGYFKMLNFGQRDIDGFNKALDRTVAQFQRVNKYSLGETISSIGVEFNLSTKEMEKAMKVTSMITSEYLRAGRNANEASLAVKDVLQGQFQRLSRETGVKGEQLKEAGWSGDTTDVLGLMEALEKVGKSRNWDVFAEKANSLNDILTISQNRFGEWSADLVYSVQPAIVGAFNMMSETFSKFANVLSGTWEWLNGDSMEGQIAKWTLLSTAITGVLSVLVAYRTGAGLLQVAQNGLLRTIASTVLGLNAEKVAIYGTRTAIMSKIFGLEAEKVATLSTKDAILSKVLGLNAEVVAQTSLRQGILDKAFAQELESLRLRGATKEELLNTLALYENQLAQKSTIGLLSAQALGLNMTTYATHGFTVALIEANTGMKASQIASMGLAKKIALLGVSFALPLAIVGAFAVALGTLALQMKASADEMKKFNELVKDGSNIIKENKDLVEEYTNKQDSLKKKLAETKEGTTEYMQVQDEMRANNRNLTVANENLANSIKAVEIANSSQKHYEEALTDMSIKKQGELAEAYMKAGYSMKEAYEMANDSLQDAQAGAEQLRVALQKIAMIDYRGLQNQSKLLETAEEYGIDKDTNKKYLSEAERLNQQMQDGMEKAMTDESFMGRMDGWLSYYEANIRNWFNDIGQAFETGDISFEFDRIWKGIAHGFADLPIFKDFWGWVFKETGVNNLKGKGWDFLEWFGDPAKDIGEWFNDATKPLNDSIVNFFNDPLGSLGIQLPKFDIWKLLGFDTVSASDGSDHPDVATEMYQVIVQPIVDWWNGFMADPLAYIGNAMQYTGIGSLISALMGVTDGMDLSWAWEWLNNTVIIPLQTQMNMFLADPLSYIGGAVMGTGIGGLINALIPNDGGASILSWIDTAIIQPMTLGIQNGIASIPIIGDIAQMLGLIPQQNPNAQDKGSQLMRALGNGVTTMIGQIPILGDILRMLGIIPQANGTANANGQGVGRNISSGTQSGMGNLGQLVLAEFNDALNGIGQLGQMAYNTARNWANQLWEGVNSILQRHSPGFFHDQFQAEFGTDIPNAITSSGETAFGVAQAYAQNVKDGISSVNLNSFGSFATDYEADTQMINASTEMMGMDTTTAFNDMSMAVNSTTNTMGSNVISTYTSMQTKQQSSLQSMKQQNVSAYNDMYLKSNQSLVQMRDSTSNITHQMTNAWNTMKNNIVASANQLKNDSTVHFNTLSNTIGGFYRKIQNPSSWGGSPHGGSTHRNVSAGRRVASAFSGGRYSGGRGSTYTGNNTMTIAQLKKKICPNGDCDGIFDGWSATDVVDVRTFLSMVETGGFGSWSDWHNTHYSHIKTKSDAWSMKSPTIQLQGGIPTNADYKVGDFESGSPKISFGSFQSMAESIFSAIPYRFYYNSDWKGSWLGALQAGACNCWDGAHAILAFANSCGFGGSIAHGTWVDPDGTTYPHVYAVINGKKMDTTGWQQRGSWSAGSPNARTGNATRVRTSDNNSQPNINVTVNINEPVYGIDDLDSKISDSIDKGLAKHFNKSYAIGV